MEAFDSHRGWGRLRDEEGQTFSFHCTAVADGSRHVEVGQRLSFSVVAGDRGRWEATALGPDPD